MTPSGLIQRGTTSACAENTGRGLVLENIIRNYLRVRGEYVPPPIYPPPLEELPPRARRIHITVDGVDHSEGTTSACAENTAVGVDDYLIFWNYLRVRGEYRRRGKRCVPSVELPPRARRIHVHHRICDRFHGTTSACAENTSESRRYRRQTGNYLRVRGEYGRVISAMRRQAELPPRARRILRFPNRANPMKGTTSACAENTQRRRGLHQGFRNYLRVRGEYQEMPIACYLQMELPPRARRIQMRIS